MQLILWRHADAVDGVPDMARMLTPRGVEQAQRMAAWLAARLPVERTRLISSPAVRARQTAQALAGATGLALAIDERLAPDQPARDYLAAAGWPEGNAIESAGQAERVVVIVAHQPVLGLVASLLLTGIEQPVSVRKAAAWWFTRRERGGSAQALLKLSIGPEQIRG